LAIMSYSESQKKLLWENPTSIVYDKKLDTALRDGLIRKSRTDLDNVQESSLSFDTKLILKHVDKFDLREAVTHNGCYAEILDVILSKSNEGFIMSGVSNRKLTKCYNAAKLNLACQHGFAMTCSELPSKRGSTLDLKTKLDVMKPTTLIANLMYCSQVFRALIDQTAHARRHLPNALDENEKLNEIAKENYFHHEGLSLTIVFGSSTCFIKTAEMNDYWMPHSYLLLIHNKIADLVSILLLAQYQDGICHPHGSLDHVVAFVTEMTKLAKKYKDGFANISGCIEGMVVAEDLLEIEEWENADLLDNIQDELTSKLRFNYKTSKIRSILRSAPLPLRNELGCMSKVLGHPFVDMLAGAIKLHKRTTKRKELTYESISWVVNMAKRTFVKNYIARHGKWPLVEIEPGSRQAANDPLTRANMSNRDPDHPYITRNFGVIENIDWARVTLQPVMAFQRLDNIIPFLKDKSISVFRNDAVRKYIEFDPTCKTKWEDTRLLLYYLLNPLKKIDHHEFLERYTDCDDLNLLADYLIIRLVPKEKEHKIEFRGFGVKSYHDRMRNLTQEKNVAKFLDLYCDEQAMTMSEIEISKKLYSFRSILKAYSGHRVLYVNFDSSGWNNCFREETVAPVLRETVSNIMGNDLLHKVHKAYEYTKFIIPDGEVTFHWDGQAGGIDGLNQYAWVWVYINQIKFAMRGIPVKYHMLCKGDDMRLAILIQPGHLERRGMKDWHSEIVNLVQNAAKQFGHEIKIQESYGSEKYFSFSKMASVGTIELPQGFRKIQKVYGANNAMIAVLDEYIASSFSNAHSACKSMTNTYGAYFVALVWSYWQLEQSMYYAKLPDDALCALLLVPNLLGGFPIIYLHNMRVRAESDLLSPFISLYQYTKMHYPGIYKYLDNFLIQQYSNPRNLERIFRDPYSLNIRTPQLPVAKLRSTIKPVLERRVRNQDIKALFKACNSPLNKSIIKAMESARPFNARIMASLYSTTPNGVLSELLKKFESGRSILDLLLMRSNRRNADGKFKLVLKTEEKLQLWRAEKLMGEQPAGSRRIISIGVTDCPTQVAQRMRDKTWGFEVHGVSMPPLSHQILLTTPELTGADPHARNNHFKYDHRRPVQSLDDKSSPHWQVSNIEPFLGFATRTGNIAPQVSFQDKDPLVVKVKNLLDMLSWVNVCKTDVYGNNIQSNLPTLITYILGTYTDISKSMLAPFSASKKSGTIYHHCRSPGYKESIVPNVLSNAYQNVQGTSNSHVTLVTSGHHYRVNFLHIMCEAIHLIQIELETSDIIRTPSLIWAVTNNCDYCNKPIEEEPIIIDESLIPISTGEVLKACRIETISRDLIMASYDDFQQRAYKRLDEDNDPDEELAVSCVVAELVEHSYKNHTTMVSRYTQHAMTTDAKKVFVNLIHATTSRQIGYTEMKKVPLPFLTQALAPLVYQYMSENHINMDQELAFMSLSKIPSYELPWHELLVIFHNCGRLGSFVNYLRKQTGLLPPACYENPASASPYVGSCLYRLLVSGKLESHIAVRTYMDKEEILKSLERHVMPAKMKVLSEDFMELTRNWVPGLENDDLRMIITSRAVYTLGMDIDVEEMVEHLIDRWESNIFNKINIGEFISWGVHTASDLLGDESSSEYQHLEWLRKKYPSWPWNVVLDELAMGEFNEGIAKTVRELMGSIIIKIGIADIASCIQILRSSYEFQEDLEDQKGTEIPEDDRYADINKVTEIRWRGRGRSIKHNHGMFIPRGEKDQARGNQGMRCNEHDFSYDKIIMDPAHSYRLYGSNTTSQNKLDHVLTVTKIQKDVPNACHILVAADGYGGFVEYFGALSTSCMFTFNTLPPRDGNNIHPYAAGAVIERNGHKINTDFLDGGVYDLSTPICTEELSSPIYSYAIVSCDADVPWGKRDEADAILENMVRIFLKGGTRDSLFICKANLGYANTIVRCIAVLYRHCTFCSVVRCPQSNFGGEVYIMAFDVIIPVTDIWGIEFRANDQLYLDFDIFATYHFEALRKHLASRQDILLIPQLRKTSRQLMEVLTCAATIKIKTKLGVDVDIEELVDDEEFPTKEDVLDKIMIAVNRSKRTRGAFLTSPMMKASKHMAYSLETITHNRVCIMQYLTSAGCKWVLHVAQTRNKINNHDVRVQFAYDYYLHREIGNLPDISGKMYKNTFFLDDNKTQSPYMSFVDGIRLGQMILGYVSHTRLPNRANENLERMAGFLPDEAQV